MALKNVPLSLVLASVVMLGGLGVSEKLKPTVSLADIKPKLVLTDLVPPNFGRWKEVPAARPVLPDPTMEAVINSTYSQILARGYANDKGQLVMLSIAYGKDQNSESTAAHRPEFCYTGQGFTVTDKGNHLTNLPTHHLTSRHLVGVRGNYVEQISYWVTLDELATLPGLGRKLAQLRYGLHGQIADGMLMRVSTPGADEEASLKLHDEFIHDLEQQIPPGFRARLFGS